MIYSQRERLTILISFVTLCNHLTVQLKSEPCSRLIKTRDGSVRLLAFVCRVKPCSGTTGFHTWNFCRIVNLPGNNDQMKLYMGLRDVLGTFKKLKTVFFTDFISNSIISEVLVKSQLVFLSIPSKRGL